MIDFAKNTSEFPLQNPAVKQNMRILNTYLKIQLMFVIVAWQGKLSRKDFMDTMVTSTTNQELAQNSLNTSGN